MFGATPSYTLPLLCPVPLHSTTMQALQSPATPSLHFYARCEDCLRGRWCERCNRWWCEACYNDPVSAVHLRTDMQQLELRDNLRNQVGEDAGKLGSAVKVYSKLCVEHCLVSEMMSGAGSNGMWG